MSRLCGPLLALSLVLLGPACAWAQARDPLDLLYELYHSSATSATHKRVLEFLIQSIREADARRAAAAAAGQVRARVAGAAGGRTPLADNTGAAVLEAFHLREAYAAPNPCKGCGSQGFVVQAGLADSVELECRSVLGQVVYRGNFPSPRLKDIGNGRGVQYTCEQHWPVSGIGRGVYACLVTARKAGQPEIRKIIRSAILK